MNKNKPVGSRFGQIMVGDSRCKIFDEKTFQSTKKEAFNVELKPDLRTTLSRIGRMVNHLVIFAIRIYQNTWRFMFPPSCRFHPSCSEYAIQALKKFGLIKGAWLSVKRLSKCHPFNPGGFDPIP